MSSGGVEVAEIIDEAPIGRLQVMVFVFCILVSFFDGYDTQVIAFVAPLISKQWGMSQFNVGLIFSATLLGSVVGSAVFGVLADRFGRKWLVVAATTLFALLTGACAFATNFQELLILRLLGGLGLGGAIPNMLALASEYAPDRKRAVIVTYTMWGFPFGAVLGGLGAGPLIAAFGWPSVFVLGGVAPLLLALLLALWLPESLRFLAVAGARRDVIVAILQRIAPERAQAVVTGRGGAAQRLPKTPISAVFSGGLASTTCLLCAALFISLFLTYLLINWTPTLLASAGMPVKSAILGAVAINLGGILGSYVVSRAIDGHANPLRLLAVGYIGSGILLTITGNIYGSVPLVLTALTACGFVLVGTQLSMSAFATCEFPVAVRGTGIGVLQGFGRMGGLIGPSVGGALVAGGLSFRQILDLALGPALLAALALFALDVIRRKRQRLAEPALSAKGRLQAANARRQLR